MAAVKKSYVVHRGKKLALTCGVCSHGDEQITSLRSTCAQCITGNRKFSLDSKYKNDEVLEREEEI